MNTLLILTGALAAASTALLIYSECLLRRCGKLLAETRALLAEEQGGAGDHRDTRA